jgi:hypothetical protein
MFLFEPATASKCPTSKFFSSCALPPPRFRGTKFSPRPRDMVLGSYVVDLGTGRRVESRGRRLGLERASGGSGSRNCGGWNRSWCSVKWRNEVGVIRGHIAGGSNVLPVMGFFGLRVCFSGPLTVIGIQKVLVVHLGIFDVFSVVRAHGLLVRPIVLVCGIMSQSDDDWWRQTPGRQWQWQWQWQWRWRWRWQTDPVEGVFAILLGEVVVIGIANIPACWPPLSGLC